MTQQSPDAKAETGLGVPQILSLFDVPDLGRVVRYEGPAHKLATTLAFYDNWEGGHPKFHLASPREVYKIAKATKLGSDSYSGTGVHGPIITDMAVLTVRNYVPLLLRHTPFSECWDYAFSRNSLGGLELQDTFFYDITLRDLANEGNASLEDRTVYSLPSSVNANGSSHPDLIKFIFGTNISPDKININLAPSFPENGVTSVFPLFISPKSPDSFNIFLGNAFDNNNSGYGIMHTDSPENLVRLLGSLVFSNSKLFRPANQSKLRI